MVTGRGASTGGASPWSPASSASWRLDRRRGGGELVRAIERASAERLPLVASPTSGGTRMQEGTVAFLQMVKISAAVAAHKAAGLPYLVYLRHPDGRRVRVVGIARACHRGRARGAHRIPRAAGVRGAERRTVPARRPGRREPVRARADRRGGRPGAAPGRGRAGVRRAG
ncbi:carboxyl transferase domain-containing protein [Yinghuangia aomiensis]